MTAKIDQKAYLQKYLGGPSEKKKKKKKVVKGKGFKIIDDDLDLSKLQALNGDELDILDQGEDAPQIAGIIDERPEEVKKAELFKSSTKWRVINQDDGFNSKLQVEEIKRDIKEVEKENEVIFGKMYSDSEDEQKNDSDLSPPRKLTEKQANKQTHKSSKGSDSDFSPPRRPTKSFKSELSPTRKQNEKHVKKSTREISKVSDDDFSPPRRPAKPSNSNNSTSPRRNKDRQNSNESPKRLKERKRNYDSDLSPPRKTNSRKDNDSDLSPPRKKDRNSKKDTKDRVRKSRWNTVDHMPKDRSISNSPQRTQKRSKNKKSSDSDMSPPRKSKKHKHRKQSSSSSSDSDLSVPRRKSDSKKHKKHKRHHESPRRNGKGTRRDDDSDLSPPRREYKRSSNSPPPSNKKMAKTLEGKLAGLQDAVQLREENEAFRRREDEAYSRMTDEVSGRNAKAVSRKGKRETSQDRQKQVEKARRQKELDEKYKKWSKGLKQIEDQEERIQDFIHEAAKPLARYKDDKDLESQLKGVERDGDPMLQYIKERKREQGVLGPEKPTYKGQFPPNRFNIRPGYRWDGVDRSNGYEGKYFSTQSKKRAMVEEAYKWSTEDL